MLIFWQQYDSDIRAKRTYPHSDLSGLPATDVQRTYPLSLAQQRVWRVAASEGQDRARNLVLALRLEGALDTVLLEQSIHTIVQRHASLRTTFPTRDGQPRQAVAATGAVPFTAADHTAQPDPDEQVRQQIAAEQVYSFDVANGPLMRATLLRLSHRQHVLLITAHPLIIDDDSYDLLLGELQEFYTLLVAGDTIDVPPLPLQVTDIAVWQQHTFDTSHRREHRRYWQQRLADSPATLMLPSSRSTQVGAAYASRTETLDLSSRYTAALASLSQHAGVPILSTLLAAFKLLLFHYSHQHDFLISTPATDRDRPEFARLIGCFLNPLVLRADVSGNPSLLDLIERAHKELTAAYAYKDVEPADLIAALPAAHDTRPSPLGHVQLSFRPAAQPRQSACDLAVLKYDSVPPATTFDLTLQISEEPERLRCTLIYKPEVFAAPVMRHMLDHFQRVLDAIIAQPRQRLTELVPLIEGERQPWPSQWSEPQREIPWQCLPELFEEQALRQPQAVAVIFKDAQLTYGELNERANQLAGHLQQLGIGPDIPVGIYVERSLDMIVGVLGVLKAGGAYLPLDPTYPSERLAFMLHDTQVPVLLTQQHLTQSLPSHRAHVLCLDADWSYIAEASHDNLARSVSPDNAAYVIYTSGSTGQPKGIVMGHAALANLIAWKRHHPALPGGVKTLAFAPLSFDASFQEMFLAWAEGGTLVVLPEELRRDMVGLLSFLAEMEIGRVVLPFAALHYLAQVAESWSGAVPKLREVVTSGEQLHLSVAIVKLFEKLPGCMLQNQYGPSESHAVVAFTMTQPLATYPKLPPIGTPIANTQIYILDQQLRPVPALQPGELYIGGICLAQNYVNRADLTAERFLPNPFSTIPGARLYKTGDLARQRTDGNLEFLGRADQQIKVRGFRVEPGEIEAVLSQHPAVRENVVVAHEDAADQKRLVAYLVVKQPDQGSDPKRLDQIGEAEEPARWPGAGATVTDNLSHDLMLRTLGTELRRLLQARLPDYMIPASFVLLDALPLTPSGKVNRLALPDPAESLQLESTVAYTPPTSDLEQQLAQIWQDVLGVNRVGADDKFFDLGGHSLQLFQVQSRIQERCGQAVSVVDLFTYPTISALASLLSARRRHGQLTPPSATPRRRRSPQHPTAQTTAVAIVGMAGRFPGAPDLASFWQNLRDGTESITFFSEEELATAGIDPATLRHPGYVKAGGILQQIDLFDAAFFGYSPREAELIDPQQRLFLECAWQALEDAGYDASRFDGLIGVYAGVGANSYTQTNLAGLRDGLDSATELQVIVNNGSDFLTTRVSYKLKLNGPSVAVQTACSTSLVAIHLACQSLLSYESDMMLAGGVSINVPSIQGYWYQEGGIVSPDGHCRAFDAQAAGAVPGNGVGIVVLKRLSDALEDGDTIHAVIRGSAINNDGALKLGYTAPSIHAQAAVISAAMERAQVTPRMISYVEAHGSGTPLGDPIEVAALQQAFGGDTATTGWCSLGSVKTNIGHLNIAAGVAGLIKTVLALKHQQLPPSLHFQTPNPQLNLPESPFTVQTNLAAWPSGALPRRAGVASSGMGGTNAHVILEEAPAPATSSDAHPWQLLILSARTATALVTATDNLRSYLEQHPDVNVTDVAYTLQLGRRDFAHRLALVCRNVPEAVRELARGDSAALLRHTVEPQAPSLIFLLPGVGDQHVDLARELYEHVPLFRDCIDYCADILTPLLGRDFRTTLYPPRDTSPIAHTNGTAQPDSAHSALDLAQMLGRKPLDAALSSALTHTDLAQPVLFVVQYALAQLLMRLGLQPQALLGYSLGEYVAACIAGVMSLEDGLRLVAARAQLIQGLPAGAMLTVQASAEELPSLHEHQLVVSAVLGPDLLVVAGPVAGVQWLEADLTRHGLVCRRVASSHAFHSPMMEPIVERLRRVLQSITLHAPKLPYFSNVTGTWITANEATDPEYWLRHLCEPVRFADAVQAVWQLKAPILLEVGPGSTLGSLALQHPAGQQIPDRLVLTTLPAPYNAQSAIACFLGALGKLWLLGVPITWSAWYDGERRARLPLPTYPFERQRYWITPPALTSVDHQPRDAHGKHLDIANWFYLPSWKHARLLPSGEQYPAMSGCWLIFADPAGLGIQLGERLEQAGQAVVVVHAGEQFQRNSSQVYTIPPNDRGAYAALLNELHANSLFPHTFVHLWSLTTPDPRLDDLAKLAAAQSYGFYSLLWLAQALGHQPRTEQLRLFVMSQHMHSVGEEEVCTEQATLLGPCLVIPHEYPHITCRNIDVGRSVAGSWQEERLLDQLTAELLSGPAESVVVYRGDDRWVQTFEAQHLEPHPTPAPRLRQRGVYLITGGLGGIGLALAEYLAETVQARLILTGRSPLPPRAEWDAWLRTHEDTEPTCRKLRQVLALEARGAEVLVMAADVTDAEAMRQVLVVGMERFSTIHGVIHAAGIAGGGAIQHKTQEQVEQTFAPKLIGTLLLDRLLRDVPLDFLVLCSSLASIIGGFGEVDYCAANAFLDAFARRNQTRNDRRTITINWDIWQEVGMAIKTALPTDVQQMRAAMLKHGILPREGGEAFGRIVEHQLRRVLVSTQELDVLLRQQTYASTAPTPAAPADEPVHRRPGLITPYIAPRNPVEHTIAAIWQELLGIDQVGIHDNFFELGGHSLIATRIITRLQATLHVKLPQASMYEAPTIADLAELMTSYEAAPGQLAKVAELRRKVQGMSPADIKALLQAKKERQP